MSTETVFVRDAAFTIRKKKRTAEGFLDVWGVSAKVGVLDYPEQGRRVWCPATVLADTSTIRDSVLVCEHPKTPTGAIDPKTATTHSVGHVGDAEFDPDTGEQVVRVRIIDAAAIADVESGKRGELSPGYEVGLVPVSAAYPEAVAAGCTHVQVYRRVNHLALTERGRGGPTVRLYAEDSMKVVNDAMLPIPAPAPQPQPQPAPAPAVPQPAPQPAPAPAPAPAPMGADEWQVAYDALMARKPAEAPKPAASTEAPKPPVAPMATDSVQRVQNATLACSKLGLPLAGLSTVDAMELAVARHMVGDSLPAQPAPGFCAGLVAAALLAPAATPAGTPAPVNTAMQLAPRVLTTDSELSFEQKMHAAYGTGAAAK